MILPAHVRPATTAAWRRAQAAGRRLCASALVLLAGLLPAVADFPEHPISLIIPLSAGGPADVVARIIGEHMGRTLKQPIVVENITGAGGTTGIARGAHARPDGYTLMMGTMGTHGAAPVQYPHLKYDPARDFAPIGLVVSTPMVIVARSNFPAASLGEFIDYLKHNPDTVTEAHGGVGSNSHTACTLLQSLIGTSTARVAYRGTGPSLNDLVAGQVDFGCDLIVNVAEHIQAGSIKAFAIATAERSGVIAHVPTTAEGGLPDFQVSAWLGLFAPRDTPPEVVAALNDAMVKALDDEGTRARLLRLGGVIPDRAGRRPQALQELVVREVERWTAVLKDALP